MAEVKKIVQETSILYSAPGPLVEGSLSRTHLYPPYMYFISVLSKIEYSQVEHLNFHSSLYIADNSISQQELLLGVRRCCLAVCHHLRRG